MLANQSNSNKMVYLHRMTGLRPGTNLTQNYNSQPPSTVQGPIYYDGDGRKVLSGPQSKKATNEQQRVIAQIEGN